MPSAPRRIIDAHHHLWDLDRIYYPWLTDEIVPDFLFGDYASIRRNYLPDDLKHDARRWNLRMSVHVEAERADSEQLAETRWLSEMHETLRPAERHRGTRLARRSGCRKPLARTHALSVVPRRALEAAHGALSLRGAASRARAP